MDPRIVLLEDHLPAVIHLVPTDRIKRECPVPVQPVVVRLTIHDVVRYCIDIGWCQLRQCLRISPMRQPIPLQRARNPRHVRPRLHKGELLDRRIERCGRQGVPNSPRSLGIPPLLIAFNLPVHFDGRFRKHPVAVADRPVGSVPGCSPPSGFYWYPTIRWANQSSIFQTHPRCLHTQAVCTYRWAARLENR